MRTMLMKFADDEAGATAIEYGLIAALVAVGIIASVTQLRNAIIPIYQAIATAIAGVVT